MDWVEASEPNMDEPILIRYINEDGLICYETGKVNDHGEFDIYSDGRIVNTLDLNPTHWSYIKEPV
jgi:hypothetical protein